MSTPTLISKLIDYYAFSNSHAMVRGRREEGRLILCNAGIESKILFIGIAYFQFRQHAASTCADCLVMFEKPFWSDVMWFDTHPTGPKSERTTWRTRGSTSFVTSSATCIRGTELAGFALDMDGDGDLEWNGIGMAWDGIVSGLNTETHLPNCF